VRCYGVVNSYTDKWLFYATAEEAKEVAWDSRQVMDDRNHCTYMGQMNRAAREVFPREPRKTETERG